MNAPVESPYAILGIASTASGEEVQQAWRDLTKVWHPDRFAHESPRLQRKAQEKLKQINAAYDALRRGSRFGKTTRHRSASDSLSPMGKPLLPMVFYGVAIVLTGVCLRAGLLFRSGWTTIITAGIILIAAAMAARAFQNTFFKR